MLVLACHIPGAVRKFEGQLVLELGENIANLVKGETLMSEHLQSIREGVAAVCREFDDAYWLARDEDGVYPHEFHAALARGGWLGITMPEAYGGAGLGVSEAVVMMHEIAKCGAMTAASSVHINMFGTHPIVLHGSEQQKADWLAPLIAGDVKVSFGVTEPDAGLDTSSIKTFARRVDGGWLVRGRKIWNTTAQVADRIMLLVRTTPKEEAKKRTDGLSLFYTSFDRERIEVRRIAKMGRKAVDSNMLFIDDLFIPDGDLIGM